MTFLSQPLSKAILVLFLFVTPLELLANEISAADPGRLIEEPSNIPTLPTVTVKATPIVSLSGSTTYDQLQISNIPSRNSNTSDLLKLMPGVQIPEAVDSSNTAGEIAPAAVSISGGRPYANNFLIDGVGNNSLLDPEATTASSISDVPGHAQELFLHNNLLDEISVLRSNISARYGNFSGGVINAKTIDPAEKFSGNIALRGTKSDWSEFNIAESKQDDFENSNSEVYQPNFSKRDASITLHTPVNLNSGLVFSYSVIRSKIPLLNLGQREIQKRTSENFFVKYQNHIAPDKTLSISALHAPYTSDYFLKNVKDSSYQTQGGGFNLTSALKYGRGDSEITFAYKNSFNNRTAPADFLSWKNTVNKDWGASTLSKEGGFGDIDNEQQSIAASIRHQFNAQDLASSKHKIALGFSGEWSDTRYDRKRDTSIYTSIYAKTPYPAVDCNGDNSGCVDSEQYFYKKTIYPQDTAEADLLQLASYIEDNIRIKQLSIRPGLRTSWDNYLNNINVEPRLAVGYDLHGDGRTTLIAGTNRYYAGNLLTMNLAGQKEPFVKYTRSLDPLTNQPLPWVYSRSGTAAFKQSSELKTPHTDEWTLGLRQALYHGFLELDYLERYGYDLLVTNSYRDPDTAKYTREWRNDGRNHHQELNASWSREWQTQTLAISGTWQQTKGNSESYADIFFDSDEELDELIWYNGKIGTKDELLISDFNRPFRASVLYSTYITPKLSFSNTTLYRSSYKSAEKTGHDDDLDIDIYEDITNDWALTFDWRFTYDVLQKKNLMLALTIDIYNVFDHHTNLGGSEVDFDLGRQVWLGANCAF